MHTYICKLTSKSQVTVPREVREALHVQPHDQICYEVKEDQTVIIRKASRFDVEYLKAIAFTLNEWESDEDEKAYGNL